MDKLKAIGEIDYNYFLLKQIARQYTAPKDAISQMVDDATGFTKDCLKSTRECLERIIKLKTEHGYDASGDKAQLEKLLALLA